MSLLELDQDTFRTQFAKVPFLLRHDLSGHELFSLPRLVELSTRLPASQVEYHAAEVPIGLDPARTPRNGLSAEETIRRIEECRSWLVLRAVEHDPAYREMLDACLSEVRAASTRLTAGMCEPRGFIFVSSPGAVTPFHMDPEENFLLHIRGTKTMSVFDPADRSVLPAAELERFLSGGHRNLAYREEFQRKARVFELEPGLAVHVPFSAPHWVQNGPSVSISFSITFNTRATMRAFHVHQMNGRLRRWGIQPAPVGRSELRDGLKQLVSRASARATRWMGLSPR
jgi:oxalate decarboxylase/phosphoglucose isomerase-like protein (cupin superfamily)